MPRNTASRDSLSGQQERFAQAPSVSIQRSTFDRSFTHKTTYDEGQLIPFLVDEILPGDTVELNSTLVVRMATPKFPIMSLLWITTHFFFVPTRIIWPNWKVLQGEQQDPDTDISVLVPTMDSPVGGWPEGSMGDYMGLPIDVDITHSALPMRAMNQIYQTWYKDQDLIDSPVINRGDGPDLPEWYPVFMRAKPHDYFTSARPWPIKGGIESTLPLAGAAPVVADTLGFPSFIVGVAGAERTLQGTTSNATVSWSATPSVTGLAQWGLNTGLEADMSGTTGPSINAMREAIVLQQALELDGRSGTRYVEALRARWKVVSPDYRLHRPEYIGGGKQPLGVEQVAQTTDAGTGATGDLGGFGYSVGDGHRASYSATEHGVLIGIVSVSGDMEYQQGMHRMWKRSERFDFYEPIFANLGEQEIFNYELFADGTATDDEVWGYQERWAEYRYKPGLITGAFRSTAALPLDSWHTAEEFASLPPLAQEFIEMGPEAPNIGRVVQVPTEPHFLMDSHTSYRHTRAMPVYSVPGLTRF